MANQTQAQETPETVTQESPMPSETQQTPLSNDVSVAAQDSEVSSTPQSTDEGLPDGASDRTRQNFEKLQEKLREERTRREYYENVFNTLQTPQSDPNAVAPIIDPDTGLVNEQALTDLQIMAQQAQNQARKAEEKIQRYEQDQENREVYVSHPELNPTSKDFNNKIHVETRRILLDSMLNPNDYGGKQLSFIEAANLVKQGSTLTAEEAKKQGAQEAIEQLTPKEQGSLEATGNSGRRSGVSTDMDTLVHQTRKGNLDALVERLRNVPAGS